MKPLDKIEGLLTYILKVMELNLKVNIASSKNEILAVEALKVYEKMVKECNSDDRFSN